MNHMKSEQINNDLFINHFIFYHFPTVPISLIVVTNFEFLFLMT